MTPFDDYSKAAQIDETATPAFKPAVSEVQTFLVPEVLRSNLASSACKHTTASFTGGESTKSKY